MCADSACVDGNDIWTRFTFINGWHKVTVALLAHKLHTELHTLHSSALTYTTLYKMWFLWDKHSSHQMQKIQTQLHSTVSYAKKTVTALQTVCWPLTAIQLVSSLLPGCEPCCSVLASPCMRAMDLHLLQGGSMSPLTVQLKFQWF